MLNDIAYLARGIPWTVAVTLSALAVGMLLGLLIWALRVSPWAPINFLTAGLVLVILSVPPIVWIFVIFFGLGSTLVSIPPFPSAVIALGIITGAQMSEVYRGAYNSIHEGQFEASKALNLTRWQTFWDVAFPQMFRIALPSTVTYAISLIKDSALASIIGVNEIAEQADLLSKQNFRPLNVYLYAGIIYISLSIPIAWLTRRFDVTLRAKVSK